MVVEGSVQRNPETLEVSFRVTDTGPEVTVLYTGILPDLFREGQGIVAQGVLIEPTVLKATEVLAKHDEEYMPPELAEAMKGIQHVNPNRPDYTGSQPQQSQPKKPGTNPRSEEHTSELQSRPHLVCRLLLEKKKKTPKTSAKASTVY